MSVCYKRFYGRTFLEFQSAIFLRREAGLANQLGNLHNAVCAHPIEILA